MVTKCSMDAAYEEHYKKHPEKRPTGDKMTRKQELIATMAHQPLIGDKALRQEVIDEMTPSERTKLVADNLYAAGAALIPVGAIFGLGKKGQKEGEEEIKRRIEAKKATANFDDLTEAIESTYHKGK